MFCSNCGNNLPDNAKFCDGCGTAMGEQAAAAYPLPTPTSTPKNPYTTPHQPAYTPPAYTPPAYTTPQAAPQPEVYQPATFSSKTSSADATPLSIGSYLGMMLITAIPLIGFIMLLVWSFGGSVNRNKKNWARAMLIMAIVLFGLMVGFGSVFTRMITSMF